MYSRMKRRIFCNGALYYLIRRIRNNQIALISNAMADRGRSQFK